MTEWTFESAEPTDLESVQRVLSEADLPSEDIVGFLPHFILAKQEGHLIGCIGLEPYGESALLRSLAVDPPFRGRGIGRALCDRMISRAHRQGIKTLYLLTTTAEGFFLQQRFLKIDREGVPAEIRSTEEFKNLCPERALCMIRRISLLPRYYPREALSLRPDVPGAKMWGVALQRTMLTYFEVAPECRFEMHRHESEQITLVLEGEAFFEMEGGETFTVKAGEVIAIPANVPHTVYTREKGARAVDAWSPVMEEYR